MDSCVFSTTPFWGYNSYSKTHLVAALVKLMIFLDRDSVLCLPSKTDKQNMQHY